MTVDVRRVYYSARSGGRWQTRQRQTAEAEWSGGGVAGGQRWMGQTLRIDGLVLAVLQMRLAPGVRRQSRDCGDDGGDGTDARRGTIGWAVADVPAGKPMRYGLVAGWTME